MSELQNLNLNDLIKRIEKTEDIVSQYSGQTINLKKKTIFSKGPFLHQDTDTITEEESADFERKNPELFAFLRSIQDEIEEIF